MVDEDVDIHNPTEVEWAVATRFQADRDRDHPGEPGLSSIPRRATASAPRWGSMRLPLAASEMTFKHPRSGRDEVDVKALLASSAMPIGATR